MACNMIQPQPCFLIANDPKWTFPDVEPVVAGLGAVLHELSDAHLAPSLIELFEHDHRRMQFGLESRSRSGFSAAKIVLARRQIERAESIGSNLGSEEYSTADPVFAELGTCCLRLRE